MALFRPFTILITAFLISGFYPATAGDQSEVGVDWLTNFDEARNEAEREGRNILISFSGSDWCLPCMRLKKELFDTEEFRTFTTGRLVLLKLDFPARKKNFLPEEQVKHNEALAEIYNKRGSFPLVVITDAKGNVIGHMEHPLSSADAYIRSIEAILNAK